MNKYRESINIIWINLGYLFFRIFNFYGIFDIKLEWYGESGGNIMEVEYFYMKYIRKSEYDIEIIGWMESGVWWDENKDKMKWYNKMFGSDWNMKK